MKYTLTSISDTSVNVKVLLDKETLSKAKASALKTLGKDIKVQGFRKGKVPAGVIEKNLDPNILSNETVENAVNIALNELINKEDLRVLDQPKIEMKKFVPYEVLEFTADMDVLPKIKLASYKKLKAKRTVEKVKKEEVDEVINRILQGLAEKTPVKSQAKNGDEVVFDFKGYDAKDQLVEGAAGEKYSLKLGSNAFIPGFEDQLVGHKAGEQFDISVKFPDDYHAEHLKSASVRFKIDLHEVNEINLPKIDDEFAKKAGPFENLESLKTDIKKELSLQKERIATDKLKDDLLAKLVDGSNVPVPEVLVLDQIKSLERDAMQNLSYRNQTIEQYLAAAGFKDKEEWHAKELRPVAVRRVQSGLVIAEVSKQENIIASKEELELALQKRKNEAPKIADQLDTLEVRRDIVNRVITEKTIDRIVELNSK